MRITGFLNFLLPPPSGGGGSTPPPSSGATQPNSGSTPAAVYTPSFFGFTADARAGSLKQIGELALARKGATADPEISEERQLVSDSLKRKSAMAAYARTGESRQPTVRAVEVNERRAVKGSD